ncbi:hypothetical protein, partial [Nonomuraea recticatena]|uniref:hypothetical protein n=1 Tax=Nonomuraea recticatena TaxID=46178 RepID=UPI0031FA14BB
MIRAPRARLGIWMVLGGESDDFVSDDFVSDGLVSDGLVSDGLVSDGLVSDGAGGGLTSFRTGRAGFVPTGTGCAGFVSARTD